MERIYLDNCAFNRPYDDQTQLKIHLETQAKLKIQKEVLNGKYNLIWSYMLEYENEANPYVYKKNRIAEWREIAKENIKADDELKVLAKQVQEKGVGKKDSIHIACALKAKVNYFITTDTQLLKKNIKGLKIISPLDYIKKEEE
ncbi:MAG: hypothetical protein FWF46_06560 [Oscillospiraceae bacterium]|nr:hypothetical protein [Oscillospiraceae bacterium]